MNKKNFNDGDFVLYGSLKMIVRLDRGKDSSNRIFCEWTDEESGDQKGDWFEESDLSIYTFKKSTP